MIPDKNKRSTEKTFQHINETIQFYTCVLEPNGMVDRQIEKLFQDDDFLNRLTEGRYHFERYMIRVRGRGSFKRRNLRAEYLERRQSVN